jgi:hypothetical protein
VQGIKTNRLSYWAGFVATATLNFYNHFNSLFVLAAEALAAGIWWLATLVAVLKKRQPADRLAGPALAFLALAAFCAPGLIRLMGLPWVGLDGAGEPGPGVATKLTVPFFRSFLYKAGLTSPGLQLVIVALMVVGLAAALHRRNWFSALLTLLWLALPFVVLSIVKSPRPFVERYLIFVPPVALLLVGQGVVVTAQMAGAAGRRWGAPGGRWVAMTAITAGLALLFVGPLRTYYAQNRAVDRLDRTLAVVESNVRPGDVVIVSPRFLVRPLSVDGADVLYLTEHLTPAEREDLAARYQRMWILYTSYLPPPELQEPLDPWVQAQPEALARVPIKAISALAFGNLALADSEANLQERIVVLGQLAEVSADRQEAWLRHGVLADAYESLAGVYETRGEFSLASEARAKAEEARAAAPRPW